MKKLLLIMTLFLLLNIVGCDSKMNNALYADIEKTTTNLNLTELLYEDDWLQTKLSKVSTKYLYVNQTLEWNVATLDSKPRSVYILCDSASYGENSIYHDSYLAVETNSKVMFKELANDNYCGSYDDVLYVCDVDGDEIDEIIIQQNVGITGGAGQYLSRIFKVVNDEILEVFNSSVADLYDTGFTSILREGFKLELHNKFNGYVETLDFSAKKQYIGVYFNQGGQVINNEIICCDSFSEFYPKDVDHDDIFEMVCVQYVSLCGHADYIGTARSVLKFNLNTQKFEVIEAGFIQ